MADRLAATLALDEPASRVKLVSPARAQALAGLGVRTVRDLLTHFPRRYIDLSKRETVAGARIGGSCTIQGSVHEVKLKRPRPNLALVEIAVVDATGVLMVTCFRQPWLKDQIKPGMGIAVAGKVEFDYGFKRMVNPYIEQLGDGQMAEGMIIPVHPACEKISAAWMRRLVGNALDAVQGCYDPLPLDLRVRYRLMARGAALSCIHFPHTMGEVAEARRRLVYEELLLLELALMSQAAQRAAGAQPTAHVVDGPCAAALDCVMPFTLTEEQQQARADILERMAAPEAANHMLLGDVGTGKTAVAAFALAAVADTGAQAALMAPTEVLARQHAASLGKWFDEVGVTWGLLTGSTPDDERARLLEGAADGGICVLIGTHALLEPDVRFKRLTLAVIDEQQRFGVEQRAALLSKGQAPDALYLTATPIPRTLALAVFGDMTLSYIKHRPNDSARRTTHVVSQGRPGQGLRCGARGACARRTGVRGLPANRAGCGSARQAGRRSGQGSRRGGLRVRVHQHRVGRRFRRRQRHRGNQGGVLPAADGVRRLACGVAARAHEARRQGRRHGPVPRQRDAGARGDHRHRGGRGRAQRHGHDRAWTPTVSGSRSSISCAGALAAARSRAQVFLVSTSKSEQSLARLAAMERTDDGFELAKYDLSLRREGDILGNRQSGASALRLVNVVRDERVIQAAHADAAAIMAADPGLAEPDHQALALELRRTFPEQAPAR